MITVYYVNGSGGGFAGMVTVNDGTMLAAFVAEKLQEVGGGNVNDYKIKVNREIQPANYVLKNGDRVTVTPAKIEGA